MNLQDKRIIKVLLMLPLRNEAGNDFFYVPDLGLGYLASGLREHFGERVEVQLLIKDLRLSDEQFVEYLHKHSFDFVGIKLFSDAIDNISRTVNLIRNFLPEVRLIAGGPHVNAVPRHALDVFKFDFAIYGEGEESLPKLIDCIVNGTSNNNEILSQIDGLVWRDDAGIRVNKRAVMDDLRHIPEPCWKLMPPGMFKRYETRYCRAYPATPIILTRGCRSHCTFCLQANSSFRKRPIESIISEIEVLRSEYGLKEFHVLDDNCAYDEDFIISFCERLILCHPGILWRIPGGICVNSINHEVCTKMAKSGCYEVWIGIESGSQKILNAMRKGITVDRIRAAISLVKKSGMKAGGFFILGYPGESSEDRRQTLLLALSLPLDYVKFTIFIPQPGTEIFNRLVEEGRINDINSIMRCSDNEFENNLIDISSQELRKVHRDFSLRFYLRPHIIMGIIGEYNSISKINYLLYAAKQFIFNKRSSW